MPSILTYTKVLGSEYCHFYLVSGKMSCDGFCCLQEHTTIINLFTKYLLSSVRDAEFTVAKKRFLPFWSLYPSGYKLQSLFLKIVERFLKIYLHLYLVNF